MLLRRWSHSPRNSITKTGAVIWKAKRNVWTALVSTSDPDGKLAKKNSAENNKARRTGLYCTAKCNGKFYSGTTNGK